MFKYVCFIFCICFFQQNLWAEADLRSYSDAAIDKISTEVDKDSIMAWESHRSGEEVLVRVFTKSGSVLELHCEIVCRKVDQFQVNHGQSPQSTLDFIVMGRDAAFDKLEKTLQVKNMNLGTLDTYKVWVHEDTGHGHDHGLNVWTQMVFGKRSVFVMCHLHGGELPFVCHYRKSPPTAGEHEGHHGHQH